MSKTIKKCAVCQESFADRFSFCPNCGAPLQVFAEDSAANGGKVFQSKDTAAFTPRPAPPETLRSNQTTALDTSKLDGGFVEHISAAKSNAAFSAPVKNPGHKTENQVSETVREVMPAAKTPEVSASQTAFVGATVSPVNSSAKIASEPVLNVSANSATARTHGEYNPTILEEKGIISRLGSEFSTIAQESRLTLPEFKRNPIGFTIRAVKGFGTATAKTLTQENVGVGLLAAFVILLTLSGAVFYFDYLHQQKVAEAIVQGPEEKEVLLTELTEPTPQPTPDPGNAGTAKGDGGGQLAEKKKPSGGGGGGREQQEPPSGGKLPPASLSPQIRLPDPDPIRIKNPSLPVSQTIKADPTLFPDDKRNLPVGVPGAKNTNPSSGPGTGGGIGSGSNGGVGTGRGGGVGPGEGGNAGGNKFGLGGNGPGGGGGNPPPVRTPTPKPTPEVVVASEPLRIISKPRANYTEAARTAQVTGTVVLKIVFNANGSIGGITVVKGLPYGLTETAISAARQIRFEPATRNGQPVSVSRPIEYAFNQF